MQIVGIGTEIVECVRIAQMIERHREQFISRVFTEHEIAICRSRRRTTEHFAARFAAKEAVWKCLAPKSTRSIHWVEIEIQDRPGDPPRVVLHGSARDLALSRQVSDVFVTFAHSRHYATAHAIAVRNSTSA
ncbi:MAG: holo-ACP synthase [Gemmataceae bacterium]|nr:holo-ACP synthase [Gemmataceae bacterium]